jgi:hypothetical protein
MHHVMIICFTRLAIEFATDYSRFDLDIVIVYCLI